MDDSTSPIQDQNGLSAGERTTGKVGWGPVSAIAFSIIVYFGTQIIGGFLVSIYPFVKGWNEQQVSGWLEHSIYAQFFFVLIVESLTIYLIWRFLRRRKAKPSDIGLKKPRLRDIGYALCGFGFYILVFILALTILKHYVPALDIDQKQALGFSTTVTGLALALSFVSLVVLPPFVEEILARGVLYTGLRSKLPVITSALITSGLFAVAHLQFGTGNALLWTAAVDSFILSMVLIYLRQKTDSLSASIMLHMIKNGIAFVSLFVLHVS